MPKSYIMSPNLHLSDIPEVFHSQKSTGGAQWEAVAPAHGQPRHAQLVSGFVRVKYNSFLSPGSTSRYRVRDRASQMAF